MLILVLFKVAWLLWMPGRFRLLAAVIWSFVKSVLCLKSISCFSGVYVDNLSEYVVRDTAEVLSLLKQGRKKLIFAETRMNRVSSRLVLPIIQSQTDPCRWNHECATQRKITPYGDTGNFLLRKLTVLTLNMLRKCTRCANLFATKITHCVNIHAT